MDTITIQRIHALGGDEDDLGWYAKGHHEEAPFRAALEESFWMTTPEGRERYKHPCEADETRCAFVQQWWRTIPAGSGMVRFRLAAEGARGAFPVSALLTPEAEL